MNKQKVPFNVLQQLPYLNVPDFSTVTGLSQWFTRKAIQDGTIPVIRQGRCVLINKQLALDLLEDKLRQQMK